MATVGKRLVAATAIPLASSQPAHLHQMRVPRIGVTYAALVGGLAEALRELVEQPRALVGQRRPLHVRLPPVAALAHGAPFLQQVRFGAPQVLELLRQLATPMYSNICKYL